MHLASYCNSVNIQFRNPVRGFIDQLFSRYCNFKWDYTVLEVEGPSVFNFIMHFYIRGGARWRSG